MINSDNNNDISIQYLSKESDILFCSITHANLGQILKPGTGLESSGPEVFKIPLHVQFDQILAEIFGVKDTCYHSFIFMIFDLLEMKIKEI